MATGNSSSKRKSSSSHKKKSSKSSSEVKKRSRKHKRSKSKKLYHRDASLSYSDDGLRSKDSVSISSSDSEVDYRRSTSRTRKEEKGSNRKRGRRNSMSDEDSRESLSPKKKQRSKRSDDRKSSPQGRKSRSYKSSKEDRSAKRKKSSHKKHASGRSRRGKSVESLRSNSRSLSIPRGGNSSGGERVIVNSRGRSEVKDTKSKRSSGKMSHGRENSRSRSRSRSRSCSSFSGHSQENKYRSEDKYSNDNYRGRIRSAVIANERTEVDGRDYLEEENKAEIIQAYDDCPSSRSNDSFDGDKKKNASGHSYVDFKSKDPKMFETAVAIDISEGNESETILRQNITEKFEASTGIDISKGKDLESVLRKKALEKCKASILRKSPEAYNLETILRQKALENYKKFQGGLQADRKTVGDQIDNSENVANYPSNEDTFSTNLHREAVKVAESKETASQVTKSATKSSVESSVGDQTDKSVSVANRPSSEKVDVIIRTYLHKEADKVAGSKETVSRVAETSMESKYTTFKDDCRIPDKIHIKHESRDQPSTSHVVPGAGNSLLSQMVAGKATQKNNASVELTINKSKLNTSRTRIVSPSDHSIDNQTPIAQNSHTTDVVQLEHTEDKFLDEIPRAADVVSSAHVAERSENCESGPHKASSCVIPPSEKPESKESGDVIKGSSQFEQKTMSVMRGGELVQVSYKVYIPNKPPALARRKLNR